MSEYDKRIIEEDIKRDYTKDTRYKAVGIYMINLFEKISDPKYKGEYKLNLHPIEKHNIEKIMLKDESLIKMVKDFLSRTGIEPSMIYNGYEDFNIYRYFCILRAENMSHKQNKEIQKRDLKVKKKQKERNQKVAKIVGAIGLAGIIVAGGFAFKELNEISDTKKDFDSSFGVIASEFNERDENANDRRNIIVQNKYSVGYNESGHPIIAYDNEGIAKDIIKICSHDARLFDACIYNIYSNMEYERINNMEKVWEILQNFNIENEEVNQKVNSSDTFLEYTITLGCGDPTKNSHITFLNAIEEFKYCKNYHSLTEESQKAIEHHMKEYRKLHNLLYSTENQEILNEIEEGTKYGR